MKKVYIFVLSLLITALSYAGHNDGMMSITNLSRRQISIEVDNKPYTDCDNTLTIRDLVPGFHMVKVYSERSNGNRRMLLFSRNINVKSRYYIDIIINRFGRVWVDEQWMNNRRDDDDGPDSNNDNQGNNNRVMPMKEATFVAFKETLNQEHFDNSKLAIAKTVIDQNYFTAEQAKQLAQMFSFDQGKLDLARYIYGKTTDKNNYFIIYSIFSFSRSKEELAEFIRNFK